MGPASTPSLDPLPAILGSMGATAAIGIVLYVHFGVTLALIAKKSSTKPTWLAWLPIGNIFLMLMIGRRPIWRFLLLLIPGVNVVVVVMTWMAGTPLPG